MTARHQVHVELCAVSDADLERLIALHQDGPQKASAGLATAPDWDSFARDVACAHEMLSICGRYGLHPQDADEEECLHEHDRRLELRRRGVSAQLLAA